jgi:hypothetical protein
LRSLCGSTILYLKRVKEREKKKEEKDKRRKGEGKNENMGRVKRGEGKEEEKGREEKIYPTRVLRKNASAFVARPKHKNMRKMAKKLDFKKKSNWKMEPVAIRTRDVRATNI